MKQLLTWYTYKSACCRNKLGLLKICQKLHDALAELTTSHIIFVTQLTLHVNAGTWSLMY